MARPPATTNMLLRDLSDAVRAGERPKPGELLERAKEAEAAGFERWTARAAALAGRLHVRGLARTTPGMFQLWELGGLVEPIGHKAVPALQPADHGRKRYLSILKTMKFRSIRIVAMNPTRRSGIDGGMLTMARLGMLSR